MGCLQIDGSGEYVSCHFQDYLITHTIFHHLSCFHTPSQNGLAERKLYNLVETVRMLLIHVSKSPPFWSEYPHCHIPSKPSTIVHIILPVIFSMYFW